MPKLVDVLYVRRSQLLQVFESNAGDLSPYDYETFSLPYTTRILTRVRAALDSLSLPQVPMTLFPKGANTTPSIVASANSGYDVVGLDWCVRGSHAREVAASARRGKGVAFQGNLDPSVLYAGREAIEREVKRMCGEFKTESGKGPKGWIANLGHGITPGVDPEDMKWFLQCVHKYSAA